MLIGENHPWRWFQFRNDSGEPVVPFGVLRITGATTHNGFETLVIARPNAYGAQYLHALNGPVEVASGAFGLCLLGQPAYAAYNSGDGVPAFGEMWGPQSGTWLLRKNTGGFLVMGNADQAHQIVLVAPAPMLSFIGKTDAAHAKGATGTISIYAGALGAETDTTIDMAGVYNRFADLDAGKWVRCAWNGNAQSWELVSAEC